MSSFIQNKLADMYLTKEQRRNCMETYYDAGKDEAIELAERYEKRNVNHDEQVKKSFDFCCKFCGLDNQEKEE